jgi:uncharacterized protein
MILTPNKYDRIIELAKEYGAKRLILFGSALDDPEKAKDLDLATDIPGWKILRFAAQIEEEFSILVDIVPLDTSDRFIKSIERKGKILYESH